MFIQFSCLSWPTTGTSLILSAVFDDLKSLSKLFATADSPVTAPAAAAKTVADITYKRQISEAIPRLNAPNDTPNEGPAGAP
jgi:hypothetical protein